MNVYMKLIYYQYNMCDINEVSVGKKLEYDWCKVCFDYV